MSDNFREGRRFGSRNGDGPRRRTGVSHWGTIRTSGQKAEYGNSFFPTTVIDTRAVLPWRAGRWFTRDIVKW
jgi:hypothetical protein